MIADSAQWIVEHPTRVDVWTEDERGLALFNLLVALSPYIDFFARNPSGPLPLLAFCTRSAFELDVRLRHVVQRTI